MPVPTADTYSAASGATLRGGRAAPVAPPPPAPPPTGVFSAVTFVSSAGTSSEPRTTPGQIFEVLLHGSGGNPFSQGVQYTAELAPGEGYLGKTHFNFRFATGYNEPAYPGGPTTRVVSLAGRDTLTGLMAAANPVERAESYWLGWSNGPFPEFSLYTERWLDAMLVWADANTPLYSKTRRYLTGASMGGWGSMTYGLRRPTKFAAVYAFMPRWRYNQFPNEITALDWAVGKAVRYSPPSTAPNLSTRDGGGTLAAHLDLIAYVANTANVIPWLGWTVGWADGYTTRPDHVAAVAAMRAAKRGFAFAWNAGDHAEGNMPSAIFNSYPKGMFEIGKGYPLFTEHSLDSDPAVDDEGGINIGLSFRNVVETPTGWACEVTHISTACTVKVEPKSTVFTAPVTPITVSIPTPMSWVPVSFTA